MNPEEYPSSKDLKDCHPELQSRWRWIANAYALMWPDDPEPDISSTFRSAVDQNRELVEGRSKVAWPNSLHNQTLGDKPASMALDFFFTVDGKTAYPRALMERVINLSRLVGLFSGITWGWDAPHLALKEKLHDKVVLPPIPRLPLAESSSPQPTIRYHDAAGTPITNRGKGDILIRINKETTGLGDLMVDIRYDEKEE